MSSPIRIGHTAPFAIAPLLVAQREGIFNPVGITLDLVEELGNSTVCAKLAEGRLDGAVMPAHVPVLLANGLAQPRLALVPVAACSNQGCAFVLAQGADARKSLRLGMPSSFSDAPLHLQALQRAGRITSETTLTPTASSQLLHLLLEGALDGFCAFDPLPALASLSGCGVVRASSSSVSGPHPGFVLALRADVLALRPDLGTTLAQTVGVARSMCAATSQTQLLSLVLSLSHYALLDSETRAAALALSPDKLGALLSTRFDAPDFAEYLDAAGVAHMESSLRAAMGHSTRSGDLRQAIARTYRTAARS